MAPRLLPPVDIRSRVDQYTERSGGLHLSTITQDILITMDKDKYDNGADEGRWMNFLMGLVFERALESAWADREHEHGDRRIVRPGEITRDAVIGTPDAFDVEPPFGNPRPLEFKCSKKSCRQDITDKKFWHYWIQLKAYAYMLGVNSGELWILHINGNYSRDDGDPEAGYIIKPWYDEWTDTQLEENWQMLRGHAVRRGWLRQDLDTGLWIPTYAA